MNGINGYQVYQNSYLQNMVYGKENEKTGTTKQNANVEQPEAIYEKSSVTETKKETVTLSENAKALLERLKQKYSNMEFTVASYSSTEEAQKYLAGGTKEFSVLIDPQLLEEMAADEATEKKYTDLLESATVQLTDMKEQLGEDSSAVHLGVSFDADGNTTFFAELEKASEKQRERIEKSRAEKKEKEKEAEKKAEKNKRTRLYADSAQELFEKIQNVDWDKVKAEETITKGSIIDFGV